MTENAVQPYVFVVLTNPVEGMEDEYNRWYTDEHLPDLLDIPGFKTAQRFELTEVQRLKDFEHPYKYFALYEIETADLQATCDLMGKHAAEGLMRTTPSIAHARIGSIYSAITGRIAAKTP